jgi:hypothetical protein
LNQCKSGLLQAAGEEERISIQRKPVAFSILEDRLENAAGAIENGIFSIYRVENGLEGTVGDSLTCSLSGPNLMMRSILKIKSWVNLCLCS